MAIREIVTLPDPVLRRKTRKVTEFTPELQTLIDDMIETMRAEPGVGLAANQVGVSWRLIVVEYGDDEDEEVPPKLYVVVNPEFTRLSKEMIVGTEGLPFHPGLCRECGTLRVADRQRLEPPRPTGDHQSQGLVGAHFPA